MAKGSKDKQAINTFSIHETDVKAVRHMKSAILSYKHLENMLNILLHQQKRLIDETPSGKVKDWSLFNLLLNPVIMKAVLSNNTGGEKTRHNIQIVNDYYHDHDIMHSAKALYGELNDKNISMVIRRLKKDWTNYFDNSKKWFAEGEASGLTGQPKPPRAKKLSKVTQYSLPLEQSKFSLKRKNCLGVTVFKKQRQVYLKSCDYLKNKQIVSVTVSMSNGAVYYNLSYVVNEGNQPVDMRSVPNEKSDSNQTSNAETNTHSGIKLSGGDVGVHNLMSLFVYDDTTDSLIIDGSSYIHRNVRYNKLLAGLNERIAREVVTTKTITRKDGEQIVVPIKYSQRGQHLLKQRSQLHELRRRFFDGEFNKLSVKILKFLQKNRVTDFVLSTNLNFTKTTGEIKMRKKDQQKFYQIPFGRLLNLIKQKAWRFNIQIHDIDEAYTSKTSCLSANVSEVQQKAKAELALTPNDFNGNRGSKGSKIGRGQFKDRVLNKLLNADLNAAANHIKVQFPEVLIQNLKTYLKKLNNPVKIKSSFEFDRLLA